MNPQFMNQQLPDGQYGNIPPHRGQGIPPSGGGGMLHGNRPMGPPMAMNGPMSYGGSQQRPPGPPAPPGNYGAPVKPPQGPLSNGPSLGPQGDQYLLRNGYPHSGMGPPQVNNGMSHQANNIPANNIPPPRVPGPPTNISVGPSNIPGLPKAGGGGYPPPGPPGSNLPNQMGAMNINSGPPAPVQGMHAPPPGLNQPVSHTGPPVPSTAGYSQPSQYPTMPYNTAHIPPVSKQQQPPPPNMLTGQTSNMPPGPYQHPAPSISGPSTHPPSLNMSPQPTPPGGMMPPVSGYSGPPLPGANTLPPNSMMGGGMPPPPSSIANSVYNQNYPQGYPQPQPHGMPPVTPPSSQGQSFNYQQGGYPPPPGGPGAMARAPTPGGGMAGPAQPSRKLDPDNMPSPIQVMETDQENRSGLFQTGSRGGLPPLCTTTFTVEDQGNSSPRFIRSTIYNVPVSSDLLNSAKIPFAVTITPFARMATDEPEPPIVDLGQLGPIRCNRCKAYMCPYMQFIDGGRRFQCAFCNCATEVPTEYFAHLDHTGRRTDCFERPELCLGTYEMIATQDYCKENKLPNPPAFIFMIDVSYNSVKSGLVHLWCERLKEDILYNLPKDYGAEESEIRVGFVTYHKELHFYNVKGSLTQPQMMVVSDIEDVFVPLLDGFLVKLSESETVIDSLLTQIPLMFCESRETEIVLGPVIQAGLDALKSAECAGKLFIFHSSLPVAPAPGVLKNRDDRKLLGTDKEKTILTPQSNFYTKLGQECVAAGCSVELYLFPNSYIDVASVAEVPRLTGGGVHKYQYFQADLEGDRFIDDLRRQVEKPIAFDCVMRVRTSTGIRPVDFFGNFSMSNTTDVDLAAIDCDKAVTVEIKHDDKLSEAEGAFIQAAVLYTSVGGQRRLRLVNLSFNCCAQMGDLFRACELDALLSYMSKHALRSTLNGSPKQVREDITTQCAAILACYRQKCASPSSAGQLILPECMKLLPVYSNCLIKSNMLQGGGDISTDDRSWFMFLVNSMPVKNSHVFFYPRLIPLHNLDLDSVSLPVAIRCSYERLQDNGAYLIENGLTMMMWIGLNIDHTWLQNVFAVNSAAQIDIDKTVLQELDNPISKKIQSLIQQIRDERQKFLKLIIVRQRDKLEPLFQQYLVEDRGANGSSSYVDFLCHIHKEIRNLLN